MGWCPPCGKTNLSCRFCLPVLLFHACLSSLWYRSFSLSYLTQVASLLGAAANKVLSLCRLFIESPSWFVCRCFWTATCLLLVCMLVVLKKYQGLNLSLHWMAWQASGRWHKGLYSVSHSKRTHYIANLNKELECVPSLLGFAVPDNCCHFSSVTFALSETIYE